MAANTLTSNSVSSTYSQILHIGTGTAGVSTVRTGDGTTTVLSFVSGGAKVTGTFEVTTNLVVGGTMAVTGQITCAAPITGSNTPVYKVLTADITTSSATVLSDVTGFDFTPVNGAVYEFDLHLMWISAATTTGVAIQGSGGATGVMGAVSGGEFGTDFGSIIARTSSPYASPLDFVDVRKGILTANSTTPIIWQIRSEVAASSISLLAGSYLKITRIS